MNTTVKRLAVVIVAGATAIVFALFAYNLYRNWIDPPDPGIIFERQNRPRYS